ncbi:MAG: class I SAM-dependent methyltransferase [Nanoarchaeota archaeon]|nr:class I SAM-dependent methyltransferase [Nanoarchaeota archaeon]
MGYLQRLEQVAGELGIRFPDFDCPPVGQTAGELSVGLKIVQLLQPKVIVEIGSAEGGHVYLLSSVLDKRKRHIIITIDPWSERTKYGKHYKKYLKCMKMLKKACPHIDYYHIRGESQSEMTLKQLKVMLKDIGCNIGFLLIDGAHSKNVVLADWKNYSPLVEDKGLIGFHDVIVYKSVAAAWQEITTSLDKKHSTIVIARKGRPLLRGFIQPVELGLGYIYKDKLPQNVKVFFETEHKGYT